MTEQEWRDRYAARIALVACCPEDEARQLAQNVELGDDWYNVETDSPEDAADEEMANWSDDGD